MGPEQSLADDAALSLVVSGKLFGNGPECDYRVLTYANKPNQGVKRTTVRFKLMAASVKAP